MRTEAKKKRSKTFYPRGQKYPHSPLLFAFYPLGKISFCPPPPGDYYRELTVSIELREFSEKMSYFVLGTIMGLPKVNCY